MFYSLKLDDDLISDEQVYTPFAHRTPFVEHLDWHLTQVGNLP